ncbi:glutathione S-transferase [Herbaspirillum sp. YR522]|uniref:glutathione S-transferase n=1 Tax=Herbaspirillum sp. YR522 TaxID=1144342 RepID=UPI00026FC533|nr:glutathione S-transferase [Herbaspirillum sp. YR522]EJM97675.1 glutathione S-transferase [Herbaspirillum sp. YR522]
MQLIGMLDSPFVRRVAISLQLLGLPFQHQPLSVFRHFDRFGDINPVVKAPTLVCDDNEVLMDSTLILEYAEALSAEVSGHSLTPDDIPGLQRALRITGLALAVCEKSVQLVYERQLRPAEKLHAPWLQRVRGQLLAACAALEDEYALRQVVPTSATIDQATISAAVAWYFVQQMVPDVVPAADHPALNALSAAAERLPEFIAAPYGDATFVWPA